MRAVEAVGHRDRSSLRSLVLARRGRTAELGKDVLGYKWKIFSGVAAGQRNPRPFQGSERWFYYPDLLYGFSAGGPRPEGLSGF